MTMKKFFVFAVLVLASNPCSSRAVDESVVSDYTPAAGAPGSVYSQIATNLAEKVSLPIFRFFGLNSTTSTTTKRPFEHIELQDTNRTRDVEELSNEALLRTDQKPEKVTLFSSYLPAFINGKEAASENSKDVEVLESKKVNGSFKDNSKLKIAGRNITNINDAKNEVDSDEDFDDITLDDVDENGSQRGPFGYVLELIGSIIQLLWGGFLAIFKPSKSSS